ncbi:hypothetical protein INT47_000859 [Mucor saturninus]|uniref:Uncharacterized protein n=1 Tax=Mucor saturninus TaxID=64648 RepID=A0A8H7RR84_9FUNG|nr:hypothetical protein INT47_000859 [Mucor saturninus]
MNHVGVNAFYLSYRAIADDVALICAPARGEIAIVRGAVLMGLEPHFVKQRVIRRTYGYECSLKFDENLDPERLRTVDQNGEAYCNNRFKSYALKGEIYAYDGNPDELPRYTTDNAVKKVRNFEIKLINLPGKGPSDIVVFDVKFYLYQTEIKLEVEIKNIKVIYTGSYEKGE